MQENREDRGSGGRDRHPHWMNLLIGLSLCAIAPAGAQTVPLAKERVASIGGKSYLVKSKLKAILVGNFTYGYVHVIGEPNLEATLKRIGAAEKWTVDFTDPTKLGADVTAAKLKDYQVFFANYIHAWAASGQFPAASQAAVQDFVETQGGGVFLIHASGDSQPSSNWPWYYSVLHPVGYTGESSRTNVSAPVFVPASEKIHPILEGIDFAGKDTVIFPQGEWHTFQKSITDVQPKAEILLRMDAAKCTRDGKGTNCGNGAGGYNYNVPGGYPATWTFPDKKGAIGYFMEGHDLITMNAMTQPVWDRFFKQFMYYIAGYDTTEITSGLRGKSPPQPGDGLDASGITFHPRGEAGVFITRPGAHAVALLDMAGRTLKEIRGSRSPVDYDLSEALAGAKSGVYVLRVAVGRRIRSQRILAP